MVSTFQFNAVNKLVLKAREAYLSNLNFIKVSINIDNLAKIRHIIACSRSLITPDFMEEPIEK